MGPSLSPKRSIVLYEGFELFRAIHKNFLMRDGLRHLHREDETGGRSVVPVGDGFWLGTPVES